MNKFLLFLILLPKKLWSILGADVDHLKAILRVKLMLDDRRPMAMGRQQQAKKKPVRFMTALSVFLSMVIGFVYIIPLMLEDTFMGLWLYFTVFLLLLSFMLISDFSTVLFDKRDNTILLPRPISERTLLLSRLLHMFIYLFRIVFPMSLAGWILIGVTKGWQGAIWFPFMVILLTITALFFVNTCYLLVLRFAKPGKFKDVINYFQIVFSVLFFACVYLMPRAMDSEGFQQLKHTDFGWARFTPTYWLAAAWSWIEVDKMSEMTKWISILSIVGPMLLVWLTVKYLSPSFAKRIGNIDNVQTESDRGQAKQDVTRKVIKKGKFYLKLADLLNRNPLGKAGFIIAWLQTNRSRNFKMRVYPTFAYVPVYFVYLITQSHKPLREVWETMPQSSTHILLLYMTSFIVLQLLSMLVYSDQYKASWVYYSSPIPRPGEVMGGAFKGVWAKYFMPMFLTVSAFVFFVWGPKSLLDILLAFINITLLALSVLRIAYRRLPFSAMERMNEKGNRFFKTMFIMLLPMGLGFGHYWTTITPWLWWMKIVFILLSSIFLWLLWDSYKNTSWDEVKKVDLSS
jgi:ABC-2 type transport system permease protein